VISTKQVNFGDIDEGVTKYHFDGVKVFEKKTFSMLDPTVTAHFESLRRRSVVLYGFEAHICVKQTCLDLLDKGFDVHLVVDGISSMQIPDRDVGMQAMREAGASCTTFQSIVFELMRTVEDPRFKKILPLLKQNPPSESKL
jgi:nicotinamidase-related amidase